MKELVHLRTATSKTFENGDGSLETRIGLHQIHFADWEGNYHDISTSLVAEEQFDSWEDPISVEKLPTFYERRKLVAFSKTRSTFQTTGQYFHALQAHFDNALPARFLKGYYLGRNGHRLQIRPVGASFVLGLTEGNTARYTNAWTDTDVILEVTDIGIKETITLKSPNAPAVFTFELLGSEISDDFTAAGGIMQIQPAWLIDSMGERRDVPQSIRKDADGRVYLDIIPDLLGLTYPVIIDPTVTIQPDAAAGIDSYINQENSTPSGFPTGNYDTNYGTNQFLLVGGDSFSGTHSWYYSFLKFDLSSIPTNVAVNSSTINLYGQSVYSQNGFGVGLRAYPAGGAWQETTITARNEPGRDASVYLESNQTVANGTWFSISVGSLVNSWVNGTRSNNGIRMELVGFTAGDSKITLLSSDHATVANRPYITVSYNVPPSAPGAITAPAAGVVVDTTANVSWGASSDSDTAATSLQYQVQLSTDGGVNYEDLVALTSAGVTSYTQDFTGKAESTNALIRVRAYDGQLWGGWMVSSAFTIRHNRAPNAPTGSTPTGTSAAPTVINTTTPALAWTFSDPDTGNYQTAYQVIIYNASGGIVRDSGKVISGTASYAVPAATLAFNTKYYWVVRTWDNFDAVSGYTGQNWFVPNQGPTVAITGPSSTSSTAPTVYHNTSTPTFTFTFSDPDGNTQAGIQVQIFDGATLAWDSGDTNTTGTSYEVPVSATLTYDKTYSVKFRAKDSYGTYGVYSAAGYFHLNRQPSQPQNLSPAGTSATPYILLNNLQPDLFWTFNDPDPTDTQNGYEVLIFDAGTGQQIHDSGLKTSTLKQYTVPAGVLISGKKYYWRVLTQDQHLRWGSWSGDQYFYTNAQPNSPSNISPAGASAQSPILIRDDLTPFLSWTFGDPDAGDLQKAFQVRIYNEIGTMLHDSGEKATASQSYEVPNAYKLAYDVIYQWEVRVKDQFDAWSNWSARGWMKPIVGPPAGIILTEDHYNAQIILDWQDSLAEGLLGYNVYRGDYPGGPYAKQNSSLIEVSNYTDTQVITGRTYYYRIEAYISDDQVSEPSDEVSGTVRFTAWFVGSFKFEGPTDMKVKMGRTQSKRAVLGRNKKVIQDGGFRGQEIEMEILLTEDDASTGEEKFGALMTELSKTTPVSVRDPFGRQWKVSPGEVEYDHLVGTGKLEYTVKINVEEVD